MIQNNFLNRKQHLLIQLTRSKGKQVSPYHILSELRILNEFGDGFDYLPLLKGTYLVAHLKQISLYSQRTSPVNTNITSERIKHKRRIFLNSLKYIKNSKTFFQYYRDLLKSITSLDDLYEVMNITERYIKRVYQYNPINILFLGSFNPLHQGHHDVISHTQNYIERTKQVMNIVLVVIYKHHIKKNIYKSYPIRLAIVKNFLSNFEHIIPLNLPGYSETNAQIHQRKIISTLGNNKIFWLVGSDVFIRRGVAYLEMNGKKKSIFSMKNIQIILSPRSEVDTKFLEDTIKVIKQNFPIKIILLEKQKRVHCIHPSSSFIRDQIKTHNYLCASKVFFTQ